MTGLAGAGEERERGPVSGTIFLGWTLISSPVSFFTRYRQFALSKSTMVPRLKEGVKTTSFPVPLLLPVKYLTRSLGPKRRRASLMHNLLNQLISLYFPKTQELPLRFLKYSYAPLMASSSVE